MVARVWHVGMGAQADQPTEGKIKAPPSAGRMWLVGLTFLHVATGERPALPGKSAVLSTARAPSLVSTRPGDVHDGT